MTEPHARPRERGGRPEPATVASLQSLLDAGKTAAALALCEQHLAQCPADSFALRQKALIHAFRHERPQALAAARRACETAPDDARCWSDFGRVLALDGSLPDALRCFQEAVEIDPRHADAWHNLGLALKRLRRSGEAFSALKKALAVDPSRARTYLALGGLLVESAQFDDAVECFERAARLDPALAHARSRLAHHLSFRGRVKRAESLFRQSIALDPDHVPGWLGLGRVLEDMGEAEGALACYRNVLARQPGHALALGQYLALARGDAEADLVATAGKSMHDSAMPDEARALLGYGLLKYHDARGESGAAAAAGVTANLARRRSAGVLDRPALTARVDGIIGTCTRDFFRERCRYGLGTDQPVFIVGLPRSGTTLTEQILSRHPLLHGSGELPDLARLAAACVAENESPWQSVLRLDEMRSRVLAGDYLQALRAGAPMGRLRISDKAPLNFFQLGLVALLFPNARVIHCTRGARDNALSIWMENFSPSQHYATDFDDLAFHASEYQRLMAHWREHLPLPILECRYEDTVDDVAGQTRKLLAFLDVPWDERCLSFHENDRAVQTPSRWQVRQPLYRRSLNRWKQYADHLPQLLAAFGADI